MEKLFGAHIYVRDALDV